MNCLLFFFTGEVDYIYLSVCLSICLSDYLCLSACLCTNFRLEWMTYLIDTSKWMSDWVCRLSTLVDLLPESLEDYWLTGWQLGASLDWLGRVSGSSSSSGGGWIEQDTNGHRTLHFEAIGSLVLKGNWSVQLCTLCRRHPFKCTPADSSPEVPANEMWKPYAELGKTWRILISFQFKYASTVSAHITRGLALNIYSLTLLLFTLPAKQTSSIFSIWQNHLLRRQWRLCPYRGKKIH